MSNEIEYTSGDWKAVQGIDGDETRWGVIQSLDGSDEGFCIATIENGAPGDTLDTEAANAHLFAASKELLAVAERVVAGGMSFPKYERELAKSAIAKAKRERE